MAVSIPSERLDVSLLPVPVSEEGRAPISVSLQDRMMQVISKILAYLHSAKMRIVQLINRLCIKQVEPISFAIHEKKKEALSEEREMEHPHEQKDQEIQKPGVQKDFERRKIAQWAFWLGVTVVVVVAAAYFLHREDSGTSSDQILDGKGSFSSRELPHQFDSERPRVNPFPTGEEIFQTAEEILRPEDIQVFTSYTADNQERTALSRMVMFQQSRYCQYFRYAYHVFEKNLAPDALPYWSKIAGINQFLKTSSRKWIVWLDDDMVFMNSFSLTQVIQEKGGKNPNTHVIVTSDIPSAPTQLNTGLIFVRNSDVSRAFFRDLWDKRHNRVSQDYSYANCPNQICLHEQQAMHDLLQRNSLYTKYVEVISQRGADGVGLNAFERFDHRDLNRQMDLRYDDPLASRCRADTDLLCQCTGLALRGVRLHTGESGEGLAGSVPRNLRHECLEGLIKKSSIFSPTPPQETSRQYG